MKYAVILCLSYMFMCSKCGLIKNFLGTVKEEVHKFAEESVVVNTVKEIVEVKKGIITDIGNMININSYVKPNNNVHVSSTTTQQYSPQNTEFNDNLLSVSKPTINLNDIIQPLDTKPILGNAAIPTTINTYKDKYQFIQTSTETYKPVVFDKNGGDAEITEYGIEPRIARQITPRNSEDAFIKDAGTSQNETDFNYKTFDISINNENESILTNFDIPLNYSGAVETIVVDGCPKGFEIAADGSCVLFDVKNENTMKVEGKNRANFDGGCLSGYGHADDGSCQEVIYD
ncbi:jg12011 [Pararge aegeria aegeria]|uniref:Jg12011 protein n=1 Tax=Pararge aegeria aegeria TaxID=348720 RepID=A0A8S4R3Z4_9NEOP|nr:jg12011 [Pararge aegeria aegeria]